MLFYFTGTGNSLYIAKQIEEHPISIPQVMKNENLKFTAERIGIVTPVYGHEVPPMVREFMRKAEFRTNYFYMVLTYGNRHGGAAELTYQLCKECGIRPQYINVIEMVDNWLPSFDMEEQKRIDKKIDENLVTIMEDLRVCKQMISEVTDTDRAVHAQFLEGMKKMPVDVWQHLLYITDVCVGCGLCMKVCPTASICMEDGKAVHIAGRCQTCLACAHHCPQKAVQLNIPERNPNARYRNEHVTLSEIIEANNQNKLSIKTENQ